MVHNPLRLAQNFEHATEADLLYHDQNFVATALLWFASEESLFSSKWNGPWSVNMDFTCDIHGNEFP